MFYSKSKIHKIPIWKEYFSFHVDCVMKSPVINDPAGATTIKQTKTSLFYPFIPFPCI